MKRCSSISGLPYDINQGCHVSYLGGGGGVVGDALVDPFQGCHIQGDRTGYRYYEAFQEVTFI